MIPCIYDDAEEFSEGLARVKRNDKISIINTEGKVIVIKEDDNTIAHSTLRAIFDFIDALCYQLLNIKRHHSKGIASVNCVLKKMSKVIFCDHLSDFLRSLNSFSFRIHIQNSPYVCT